MAATFISCIDAVIESAIAAERIVGPVVLFALTNTAFEGMANAGRFPADLSRSIYASSLAR